ncbi:MAG: polymer-forming cytoskeletal protein [Gammaproteobacteria bacterium]|nr:polymer-forming cytoskeletal protein [Gammaproteobacteria bacterium]
MFGNTKGNPESLSSMKYETTVFSGLRLTGEVKFSGSVYFDGRLKGNINNNAGTKAKDDILVVGPNAKIVGNISAKQIYIMGDIEGNIYAVGELFLLPGSSIQGDVHYNVMEMSHGAKVNGRFNYLNNQTSSTEGENSSTTDKSK